MQNSKTNYLSVFKFGGAFVAFIIGSGFATGQEILQFFTVYGIGGIIGSLVTLALFTLCGGILMNYGYKHKNKKNDAFHHYCGKYFGIFMEWFTPIFCFMITVIMISGAGATLNQYFGLPNMVGRVIMAVLTVAVTLFGLKRLVDIIGYLGPFTILITLIIGIITVLRDGRSLSNVGAAIANAAEVPYGVGNSAGFWFFAACLYAAYNLTCSVPFLSEMGAQAKTRKEAVLGGILGGALLMLSGLVLAIAMMCNFEEVVALQIPVLFLAQKISPVIGAIFTAVLIGEIFSTAAPMLWTVANKFGGEEGSMRYRICIIGGTALAFVCSAFPFGTLVGTVYPATGYIGLALIICILARFAVDIAKSKKA